MAIEVNTIVEGDCLAVMRKLPDNSIDTVITDPPYELGFMGKSWDSTGIAFNPAVWSECLRVAKPGATLLAFGGSRTFHRIAVAIEDAGWVLKDTLMWLYGSGFPKATDISKQLDKGHEREVIGVSPNNRDRSTHTYNSVGNVGSNAMITAPATPEAKLWNGWKSHGLKPAYEPIIMAVKPNEGSYAENALKWGVAGLNIDGGRIGTDEVITNHSRGVESAISKGKYGDSSAQETHQTQGQALGRFPANILFDEDAAQQLGEPSRFFYVAKASKSERNMGCEDIEAQALVRQGLAGEHNNPTHKNFHPTVKPLKLMEYLCTLTRTPTGGIVLDPFAGSGTTCMAAKATGRPFIGIEMTPEYVEIANKRILAVPQPLL